MKRLILMFAAVMFSFGMCAQGEKMHKMEDNVMMKDGKMMMMKDGKTMMMEKEMTMPNGTMIMMDGNVKMKDGKTMMMKNGEMMDMHGNMMMDKKMMKADHMKMEKMDKSDKK